LDVTPSAPELWFADDVDDQLPEVVQRNRGALALLDEGDLTMARYILQPPSWEVKEGFWDVSRKFRVTMKPPRKWLVFRAAAEKYGIDLDHYEACAMFDDAYRHCLYAAIRTRALSNHLGSARRVSALLAFAADRPCGIEVRRVWAATTAAR
jgi:hypothetical protein